MDGDGRWENRECVHGLFLLGSSGSVVIMRSNLIAMHYFIYPGYQSTGVL